MTLQWSLINQTKAIKVVNMLRSSLLVNYIQSACFKVKGLESSRIEPQAL